MNKKTCLQDIFQGREGTFRAGLCLISNLKKNYAFLKILGVVVGGVEGGVCGEGSDPLRAPSLNY